MHKAPANVRDEKQEIGSRSIKHIFVVFLDYPSSYPE